MPTGTGMSAAQARVIDPILTQHARGYVNGEFVGRFLFPAVTMPTRAAKRIEFDRSAFRRRQTRRAPGGRIAQLEFGYEGKAVNLHQEALRSVVPFEHQEEANAVPGIDLTQTALDIVLAVIALEKEIQQAEVARNATLYPAANKLALAGTDKWSDPLSDPQEQINDAVEVIRKRTGRRPNTLLMGATARGALKVHPKIRDHFKYTQTAAISNQMIAEYLDIPLVVSGDGIYDTSDTVSVDIWGNDAILAYVPPESMRNMALPSYGYTYQLAGQPLVEATAWDKDTKSWGNDVLDEFSAELVGADAGFLFQATT